jgi:capsular exopolysaccharide synthesis family protein
MTVREYIDILVRRKVVILATCAVITVVALIAALLAPSKYRAYTLLRVLSVSGGGSTDWVVYDTRSFDRLVNTYAEFASSRPVLSQLAERLQLAQLPKITVTLIGGTELMQIMTESGDPVVARDAANALGEILVAQSRALYAGTGKTAQDILAEQLTLAKAELDRAWLEYESLVADSPADAERIASANRAIAIRENTYSSLLEQYERNRVREAVLANTLSVVEPAVTPREPASPRKELTIALGFVVGLVAGVGLAFLIENLDTTLYATEQIQRLTELPLLGRIPSGGKQEHGLLFNGSSSAGEAFRRLRTNIFTLDGEKALGTLMVTSAEPQEGKSAVAANLAFTVSQSGRTVVLVDAHLRLPTLHKIFELSNRVGLSSVLNDKMSLEDAIQETGYPRISVLTSGPLPEGPAEMLSSPQMTVLIQQLAERYDMVLLDTPAILAVTDAAVLARDVDGVVLVVERAQARQETVQAARQQLADVRAHMIGLVVNRAGEDGLYDYYRERSK